MKVIIERGDAGEETVFAAAETRSETVYLALQASRIDMIDLAM